MEGWSIKRNGTTMRLYNAMRVKAWFEKGYGLSHYLFKLIAVLGLTSGAVEATIYACIAYTIFCFILGFCWYHFHIVDSEIEVTNRYDPFVREMRAKFK